MKKTFALMFMLGIPLLPRDPLDRRIGHTDPSKYTRERSHASAGDMACETLVPESALTTTLDFIHRCQIMPGGGVGHHFQNRCEEMFIIFDGEAEFTIDGRTSLLKGTVGAPCRMGHSHAIYNPSDHPVEFMNINVTAVKGKYDALDLNDARTNVKNKDLIPVFMTMRLDKELLRSVANYHGGEGTVRYRRALDSTVFQTNWSYVDRSGVTDRLCHHPRLHGEWLIVDRLAFRRAARGDLIKHLVPHFREPSRA